ncbi:hypothetical protein GCM10022410_01550 [Amphibacillus indicireducens]|uniref:Uncharacterized protein n=1 Tax=Amphibacillus indicireducens TaxID=1076330 RepID=A0ABP7V2B3_9BACI
MNSTKSLYLTLSFIVPCIIVGVLEIIINPNNHLYIGMLFAVLFITLSQLLLIPFKRWVFNCEKTDQLWRWAFDITNFKRITLYVLFITLSSVLSTLVNFYITK